MREQSADDDYCSAYVLNLHNPRASRAAKQACMHTCRVVLSIVARENHSMSWNLKPRLLTIALKSGWFMASRKVTYKGMWNALSRRASCAAELDVLFELMT